MPEKRYYRIGQIVPSSNTTMETEIPAMFRARETVEPERFTFHSSRMRMKKVTKEELAAMDRDSDRCALELSDALRAEHRRSAPLPCGGVMSEGRFFRSRRATTTPAHREIGRASCRERVLYTV